MNQNPILTIAQNLFRKKLVEEGKSRGIPKDEIEKVRSFLTPDKVEKDELAEFLREYDEELFFVPNEDVLEAMTKVTKSKAIKAKIAMFANKEHKTTPILEILARTAPFDMNSRYRKMSSRVCEYISSLGSVSKDLCKSALEDLSMLRDRGTGIFHDMILIDTTKGPIIMEAFLTESAIQIIMRLGSLFAFSTHLLNRIPSKVGTEATDPTVLFDNNGRFNPLCFYVNIYLAEKTNHLVPGKESNYDKKKVIEICRAENKPYDPKDKSVRYEYIDVSEDRWKQHTEFKNAVHRKMEGDRKWYKSHWWRKAHYMRAGKDKHLAFVESTICHRSCGAIEEDDVQVVQVLR